MVSTTGARRPINMPKLADEQTASKPTAAAKKASKCPKPRRTKREHLLPYPEFPLFPHGSGRWARKIRGKLHYFGRWDGADGNTNWEEALADYKAKVDDLQAGRAPRPPSSGVIVADVVNTFLTDKKHLVDTGERSSRTWADYYSTCERIVAVFGRDRLVLDLTPDDFRRMRQQIAKTRGVVALGNEVQRVRTVFAHAFANDMIDRPVRFGSEFKRPNRKALRKARQAKGRRMLEPSELRMLISKASQPLRTMIYLGLNCGFGNADVGSLPLSAVDLATGWVDYPRPKTAVERRVPLWPETVESLRAWLILRPPSRAGDAKDLVFVTKYGRGWAKSPRLTQDENGSLVEAFVDNPVSKEFRKLLDGLGLHRPGLGFYLLRHVFETIGGEAKDQVAVNAVMGHADASMAAEYRERISDERLRAVTEHVRKWLWPPKAKRKKAK
jgi:integrase